MSNTVGRQTLNHKKGKGTRSFCVYTVYDNRTDLPIIIDGTARECAEAMHIDLQSFYACISRIRRGLIKRWYIEKRYLDGKDIYEID